MTFLTVGQIKDNFMGSQGAFSHVSHFGALKTSPTHPVLKANFPGSSLDSTIWDETIVGAATNPIGQGVARPTVTTASGDSVILQSMKNGIFEAGQVTVYQSGVYPGVGIANNTRRWGLMDSTAQNGLFFEWVGTTFQVTARKAGSDTSVTSALFNGEANWTPGNANNTFRIFYSAGRAIFCRAQAGNIRTLHTMVDTDFPLVEDLDLGLYYENTNTGVTSSGVEMRLRGASSSVFGELPTIRANGAISDDTVLELTKSIVTGRDNTGVYRNVSTNTGSALLTSDFLAEVALGNVTNYSSIVKFGTTATLPAGAAIQDVWQGSGAYTGQPTGSAETIEVFSSSANDTSAGTGARTIRVFGLDDNWDEQTEDFTLNGTTPVASVTLWRRVFRAFVLTAGSGGENAGVLTVRHTTTTANVFVEITAGFNQTQIAAYTVPNNRMATMVNLNITAARTNGSNGSVDLRLITREQGSVYRSNRIYQIQTNGGLYNPSLELPIILSEMTDIIIRTTDVSDNNTIVTASFGLLLVNT